MQSDTGDRPSSVVADPVLIVIDMQNDFCKPGYAYDQNGNDLFHIEKAVKNTGDLLSEYRRSGRKPILVRTTHDNDSNSQIWSAKYEGSTMPCQSGTEGTSFVSELSKQGSDIVVTKHRYDAFHGTDLDVYLSSNEATRLLFAGVATNVCVSSTVRSAFDLGYDVTLLADCVASADRARHDNTLENVEDFFGSVANSSEVTLPKR